MSRLVRAVMMVVLAAVVLGFGACVPRPPRPVKPPKLPRPPRPPIAELRVAPEESPAHLGAVGPGGGSAAHGEPSDSGR